MAAILISVGDIKVEFLLAIGEESIYVQKAKRLGFLFLKCRISDSVIRRMMRFTCGVIRCRSRLTSYELILFKWINNLQLSFNDLLMLHIF
jgi:hypothetical protein